MKMPQKWRWPQNEDSLKNGDNLENEDDLENKDNLKIKTVPGPSLHSPSRACSVLGAITNVAQQIKIFWNHPAIFTMPQIIGTG